MGHQLSGEEWVIKEFTMYRRGRIEERLVEKHREVASATTGMAVTGSVADP